MTARPPHPVEARCRFVFIHCGGRFGLTTDREVASAAAGAGLPVTAYIRDRDTNVTEWEVTFGPPDPAVFGDAVQR
jgi:hypothetical protein